MTYRSETGKQSGPDLTQYITTTPKEGTNAKLKTDRSAQKEARKAIMAQYRRRGYSR